MCGLYGSIGFPPEQGRIDIVAHRGPDGRGWKVFDGDMPVALGHRRLAIIDTSDAGLQPMQDPTGRFHLVFNGEIYNYLELRAELAARGEVFTTQSDSEVLLRAYAVWGSDVCARLRGMFAFLIWDARERQLFAARDRFGIKPLYYVANMHGFAFGSEIKQLLGLPGVSGRMNVARVHDFLASGISDHTSETMFDGVNQLRGGEYAQWNARRPAELNIKRWYEIKADEIRLSEADASARFGALLNESVRLHLRADVPIGSCLSGGLDSSSIVCLMADMLGGTTQIKTVSACYAEKSVDEKPFMDEVVAHAHTQPYYVYPRAEDVFAEAETITWHQDEPFGSTSIFAQWCVFSEARRAGVKVMLDGQGADEQLAGYHSAFHYYMAGLTRQGRAIDLLRTILQRNRYHGTPVLEQVKRQIVPLLPASVAAALRRGRMQTFEHNWLSSDVVESMGNPEGALATASRLLGLQPVQDIASLCMTLTHASNLQMLLHWEDRNSMAHAIEARVPFLDHPLVEFSLGLGEDHKIVHGDTKRVLRRAMKNVLPEAVRERRDKLGFATPEQIWFRGALRSLVTEGIEQTLSLYPSLLNAEGVRKLADDMLNGRRPLDFTLWRIVNLGIWGRKFAVAL